MKSLFTTGIFLIAIALMMPSCKKDHTTSPSASLDSLAFGEINSLDITPMSGQLFILKNDSLYTYDTPYSYQSEHVLSDSLYQIAKYLMVNFPAYLVQHPQDTDINCPGCVYENTIMLYSYSDNKVTKWKISADTADVPAEIRQYVWRAGIIIDQLQ